MLDKLNISYAVIFIRCFAFISFSFIYENERRGAQKKGKSKTKSMKYNFLSFIYSFIYLEAAQKKAGSVSVGEEMNEKFYLSATPLVRIILSDDQITIFFLVKYCCNFFKRRKKKWQKGSEVAFLYLISLKLLSAYFIFILISFAVSLCGWL